MTTLATLSQSTPTGGYPCSLELIKRQLRIDHSQFDSLITQLHLPAAISWAEGFMNRAIMPRTVTAVYTDFPPGGKRWRLPLGKTQSVASIAYRTVGGTAIITGPSSGSPEGTDWEEDLTSDNGGILWSDSWPSPVTSSLAPVRVTFTAGWADADQVPADVKTGLVACIADLLETVTSDEGRNVLIKHNQAEAILSAWRIARV